MSPQEKKYFQYFNFQASVGPGNWCPTSIVLHTALMLVPEVV